VPLRILGRLFRLGRRYLGRLLGRDGCRWPVVGERDDRLLAVVALAPGD
jgi:hypothetical protein